MAAPYCQARFGDSVVARDDEAEEVDAVLLPVPVLEIIGICKVEDEVLEEDVALCCGIEWCAVMDDNASGGKGVAWVFPAGCRFGNV